MERGHQQTLLEIDRGNFRELYHSQIMAVQADAQAIPFPAGRFDAVIAVQLFGLIPDEDRFFAELGRVMRPGGCLFISWTNRASLKGWLYSSYSALKGTPQAERHGFYQHSHTRNLALMQSHGFTPLYIEGYSWQMLPRSHDGPLVDLMVGLERGLGLHRWPAASPNVILAARKA
jgi:ubiquinone/menaquinone biosynthesis C-methylase UbiE